MSIKTIWLATAILFFEWTSLPSVSGQKLPPIHDNITNYDVFIPVQAQMALYLSLGILIFGLILCVAEIAVIFRKKEICWDQSTIRALGLTLILIIGAFLITAGYSEYQIASMMGLLGTMAGYLLAKTE